MGGRRPHARHPVHLRPLPHEALDLARSRATVRIPRDDRLLVHGKTLGILGLGRIGRAVARRAQGFDMRLLYHDAVRDHVAERDLGVAYVETETLLREADFVTLHVPLLPETRHYVGEPKLRRMEGARPANPVHPDVLAAR